MPPVTASARASAWEWIQAALLAVNLAWTTLCLGGYLAGTMVVSSVLTCLLLAVHLLVRAVDHEGRRAHAAGWWLLPFLVYAAVNVLWVTPVRWLGWQDWYNWAQAIATFWVVLNGIRARGPRTLLAVTFAAVAVIGVFMACYQRFAQPDWIMLGRVQAGQFIGRASGPFGAPNSFAGLLLLLLPAAGALSFRPAARATERVFFGWLTLVLAWGLILTISRGAWLALALALVAWPFLLSQWSWRRRLGFALGVLAFVTLAGAVTYQASPKARVRLQGLVRDSGELSRPILWRAAWKIFRAHPVAGGGAGSFNSRFEEFRPEREQTEPVWAHNDYLNVLSDYGALGGLLLFGGCGAIAWGVARRGPAPAEKNGHGARHVLDDPVVTRGLGVGLLAFSLQLFVEFHFRIPALALSFAAIAALIVGRAESVTAELEPGRSPLRRTGMRLSAVLVGVLGFFWIVPAFRAEGIRERSRRNLDRFSYDASPASKKAAAMLAAEEFARATALDPANAQAWADRAYALSIVTHADPSQEKEIGREAETYGRRALAGGMIVPEFWLRVGVALDMQGRWNEANGPFSEALRLAPVSAQTWFYEAYHLALNPVTRPRARSAVAISLRLDPSRREGDTLSRNLASGR